MTQVTVEEAQDDLEQLIVRALAGESIVIVGEHLPAVRLVPTAAGATGPSSEHGTGHAVAGWLDAHPLPAHLARTTTEIDAEVTGSRTGWE